MARRAHFIESIRNEKRSVLLLDCGGVFGAQENNAEFHLKAMKRMGYDALNLGVPELSFGKAFLERTRTLVSFPYISSNLLYERNRPPWIREFVIKELGGIKAAVLGVLDPEDLKNLPAADRLKGFEVIAPEAALNRLLPEVKKGADLIILLSQSGEEKTLALTEAVRGIDVAIFSEKSYPVTLPKKNTVVLHAPTNGTAIGLVTIALGDQKLRTVKESRTVQLDRSVPDNRDMLKLVETHKKAETKRRE